MVVSCVYGEQQERGGEGREEDEVGEGYGHWSTLLQRQRGFFSCPSYHFQYLLLWSLKLVVEYGR